MKLHGSIDLYWLRSDPTGDSIVRRPDQQRWGQSAPGEDGAVTSALLQEREPLIIPPLTVKSNYYSLPFVRQQWQSARARLRSAEAVVIIGYSAPLSDLAVGGLLSDAGSGEAVKFVVADYDPSAVVERLTSSGVTREPWRTFGGDPAARRCAEWLDEQYALGVPDRLRAEIPQWTQQTPDRPVVLRIGLSEVAILRSPLVEGDSLVLEADPPQEPQAASMALARMSPDEFVESRLLLELLNRDASRIVRVRAKWGGRRYRVLGGLPHAAPSPGDPGGWFNLLVQRAPLD